MTVGRTQPCLMICENKAGDEIAVLVKLHCHPQLIPGGLLCEAFAALLAMDLDLPVQMPYEIMIDSAFANTIPDSELRSIALKSEGPNFGSLKWPPGGYTEWGNGRSPSIEVRSTMMELFAFDAVIQNPDRRLGNPNCVFRGKSDILIYDHEAAFSHFLDFLPTLPWMTGGLRFLKNHIFCAELRGESLSLDRFQAALEAIDEHRLNAYIEAIPSLWNGDAITSEKIKLYLIECIKNFDGIKSQLKAIL